MSGGGGKQKEAEAQPRPQTGFRPLRAAAIARFLSTEGYFSQPVGPHIADGRVHGYYSDLRIKARDPAWPPAFSTAAGEIPYDVITQMGLGAYERFLAGDGEQWLAFARELGDRLLREQHPDGKWPHLWAMTHTFPVRPPWISGMAQGQGASLLVRLHGETGDDRYAEAAQRAVQPLAVPSTEGGAMALLNGRPFPEEYPTNPPSYVLNGGIFGMWGLYDVALGLGDAASMARFEESVDGLASAIDRWDIGFWSRYDLFPHPVRNVASTAYHALHINQLEAMNRIAPRAELAATLARFRTYPAKRRNQVRAFAGKALFRMTIPRSERLNRLLPWAPGG